MTYREITPPMKRPPLTTEPYIHELRKYLKDHHDTHPENKNLSAMCSFYLLTALTLLKGIQNLVVHTNHFSAAILERSLVEICINLFFILREDSEERAAEMIKSSSENRKAYKNNPQYNSIEKRARAIGLEPAYNQSYRTLCSYGHISPNSWLAFNPFKSKRFVKCCLDSSIKFYKVIVEIIADRYKYPIPSNLKIIDTADALKIKSEFYKNMGKGKARR